MAFELYHRLVQRCLMNVTRDERKDLRVFHEHIVEEAKGLIVSCHRVREGFELVASTLQVEFIKATSMKTLAQVRDEFRDIVHDYEDLMADLSALALTGSDVFREFTKYKSAFVLSPKATLSRKLALCQAFITVLDDGRVSATKLTTLRFADFGKRLRTFDETWTTWVTKNISEPSVETLKLQLGTAQEEIKKLLSSQKSIGFSEAWMLGNASFPGITSLHILWLSSTDSEALFNIFERESVQSKMGRDVTDTPQGDEMKTFNSVDLLLNGPQMLYSDMKAITHVLGENTLSPEYNRKIRILVLMYSMHTVLMDQLSESLLPVRREPKKESKHGNVNLMRLLMAPIHGSKARGREAVAH